MGPRPEEEAAAGAAWRSGAAEALSRELGGEAGRPGWSAALRHGQSRDAAAAVSSASATRAVANSALAPGFSTWPRLPPSRDPFRLHCSNSHLEISNRGRWNTGGRVYIAEGSSVL